MRISIDNRLIKGWVIAKRNEVVCFSGPFELFVKAHSQELHHEMIVNGGDLAKAERVFQETVG